jgi:UDPglucose--hexose-1-phosphate uridylyltransferase
MEMEEHSLNETDSKNETGGGAAARTVERLLRFALAKRLIEPLDVDYCRNALLDLLQLPEPDRGGSDAAGSGSADDSAVGLLNELLDYAAEIGVLPDNTTTYRDLLDAKIMGILMPRPSEVAARFARIAGEQGVRAATDEFYAMSIDSNYIRMDRIAKNLYWLAQTDYGSLEITINLSKPEKDPREIAKLKSMPAVAGYPSCLLCPENVGYAGRLDHPARQNLRLIPLKLGGGQWFLQYSPYVYYNEHCIVLNERHVPMKLSAETFRRLLDFVDTLPHYFIGSNADLPIVGGSILNHDHFQGGRHRFPMEDAPVEARFTSEAYPDVAIGMPKWPMSVIRLNSRDRDNLLQLADRIYTAWQSYSDPTVDVLAFSAKDGAQVPHNTVTPIVRRRDGSYEMDLVLRNNRTSAEHPDGIFHPHQELHHIKKENIGLIEVMGLAVLPGRLSVELDAIAAILAGSAPWDPAAIAAPEHALSKHAAWIASLIAQHGASLSEQAATEVVRREVGAKFARVLEDAGVFKHDTQGQAAFARFMTSLGLTAAR